jgi:hypothetical protein
MGVWSRPDATPKVVGGPLHRPSYELDVDCDGDGVKDAIWMDLDFPIVSLPDGRQFVPLFAMKVVDADALLNVNAHGNTNRFLARTWDGSGAIDPTFTPGDLLTDFAHASNQGLSRTEVNLGLGLTATPAPVRPQGASPVGDLEAGSLLTMAEADALVTNAQAQHFLNYGLPGPVGTPLADEILSNLELANLLNGREVWRPTPAPPKVVSQVAGRLGDDARIRPFYRFLRGEIGYQNPPAPGGFLLDDDNDSNMLGFASFYSKPNPERMTGNLPYPQLPLMGQVSVPAGFFAEDEADAPVYHDGNGSAFRDPDLLNVWVPPFVHPLDYGGTGSDAYLNTGTVLNRRLAIGNTLTGTFGLGMDNPGAWPAYRDALMGGSISQWQYQFVPSALYRPSLTSGEFRNVTGVTPYRMAFSFRTTDPNTTASGTETPGGALQTDSRQHDFLRDEGDEVILDPRFRNPEYDAVFPTSEMEGLHLSTQDFQTVGASSRLKDLAVVNFSRLSEVRGSSVPNTALAASAPPQFNSTLPSVAQQVRGRFTTDSWDRLEFAHSRPPVSGLRNWEFSGWNHPTTTEFQTTAGGRAFPPEFGTNVAGSATDPFRPEIRLLLKSELNYTAHLNPNAGPAARFPQQKLNINRVLSDDPDAGGANNAFDADENPHFRNLMPHPNLSVLEDIDTGSSIGTIVVAPTQHSNSPTYPYPFNNLNVDPNLGDLIDEDILSGTVTDVQRAQVAQAQEWWARYDRQRLARDIYTLLWTVGGSDKALTPPANFVSYAAVPYTTAQITEMAQFAVNTVDALDRDNVISRFEFDTNLINGWGNDMSSVDGVEAANLVFSEVLYVQTTATASNDANTLWDDDNDHNFLFIELRNLSPFDVEFGDSEWRIVRKDMAGTANIAEVEILRHAENKVKSGRTFLIACQDNMHTTTGGTQSGQVRPADLYVNYNTALPGFEAVVPFRRDDGDALLPTSETDSHPEPMADLDLSYTEMSGADHTSRRMFTLPLGGTGTLVHESMNATDATIVLALERRRNPLADGHLDYTADDWGQWIEVDRIEVDAEVFVPSAMSLQTDVENLASMSRSQPLNRASLVTSTLQMLPGNTGQRSHTLGDPSFNLTLRAFPDDLTNIASRDRNQGNSGSPPAFTVWQPHFDRDFSSVFELLSIPLFGPADLTNKLIDSTTAASAAPRITGWFTQATNEPALAGVRFERVDPLGDTVPGAGLPWGGTADDNHWYRLLEFLTVPSRTDESLRDRMTLINRTPGRINLNTLRDETVLAALLDDEHIGRFTAAPFVSDDTFEGVGRNWHRELLLARDGIDPLNFANAPPAGVANPLFLPLPGIPGVPRDVAGGPPQFGAIPFRSLSHVGIDPGTAWPNAARVDPTVHTLLRNNTTDLGLPRVAGLEDLGIFEARPTTDLATNEVDFHTRNRLLAKVANNTTNRSNVFAVWLTVEFFEAHQPLKAISPEPANANSVVQIGGRLAGSPTYRSFFVLDRTRLEEAVDRIDNKGTGSPADDAIFLDWRAFVIHRRTIQSQ